MINKVRISALITAQPLVLCSLESRQDYHRDAAAYTVQTLTETPAILMKNPRIGEQLFQFEPREVRRILVGNYEIRYEISDNIIYILRLWHTRENR